MNILQPSLTIQYELDQNHPAALKVAEKKEENEENKSVNEIKIRN